MIEAQGTTAVRIAAGHPDGTCRLADGDGDKSTVEGDSFGCEFVNVRGDVLDRAAVCACGIAVHVIDIDKK